jgi:G3E family GTPase
MRTQEQPTKRIPVTLIGGFLGAGKATLLNHVLSEEHGVRAAVLVNDFGAINIDAKLVVGVEGETVSLANGCVCCTIRDDLVGACLEMLRRPEPPEHLLIEMSGVSDPVPVLNTFLETELGAVFSLNSILAVVDAEQLLGLEGEMRNLARVQIQAADIVVLNKVDLVSPEDLAGVKKQVHETTPGSRIIEVTHGRIPLELVFSDSDCFSQTRNREDSRDPGERSHDDVFSSWDFTSDRPLSLPKLRSALETLLDTVYRCKGIVYLEELPMRIASTRPPARQVRRLHLAELRTRHARNQATDWFCFPLVTGTRGIQGDYFRVRPITEFSEIGYGKGSPWSQGGIRQY